MPAIQPARLKQQAALVAEHFEQPAAFIRSLNYLLEYYADRTLRPSAKSTLRPLIETYHVPAPVLQQVMQALTPQLQDNPQAALALCDALWEQPFLEHHTLSAMLLGHLSTHHPEAVLERIQAWISPQLEDQLIFLLFDHALVKIRKASPVALLRLIQTWLESDQLFYQQLGLRALLPLIRDPEFENLPIFFRLVHPYLRQSPAALRPDVLDLLTQLARRSPLETAHYLRQTLGMESAKDTPWFTRQVIGEFPPALQASLRKELRRSEGSPIAPRTLRKN